MMRKHLLKIDKSMHFINSEINTERFLELQEDLLNVSVNEKNYKSLILKNQETLKEAQGLIMKLAEKIGIRGIYF
jgi:hypothetical protein